MADGGAKVLGGGVCGECGDNSDHVVGAHREEDAGEGVCLVYVYEEFGYFPGPFSRRWAGQPRGSVSGDIWRGEVLRRVSLRSSHFRRRGDMHDGYTLQPILPRRSMSHPHIPLCFLSTH